MSVHVVTQKAWVCSLAEYPVRPDDTFELMGRDPKEYWREGDPPCAWLVHAVVDVTFTIDTEAHLPKQIDYYNAAISKLHADATVKASLLREKMQSLLAITNTPAATATSEFDDDIPF